MIALNPPLPTLEASSSDACLECAQLPHACQQTSVVLRYASGSIELRRDLRGYGLCGMGAVLVWPDRGRARLHAVCSDAPWPGVQSVPAASATPLAHLLQPLHAPASSLAVLLPIDPTRDPTPYARSREA